MTRSRGRFAGAGSSMGDNPVGSGAVSSFSSVGRRRKCNLVEPGKPSVDEVVHAGLDTELAGGVRGSMFFHVVSCFEYLVLVDGNAICHGTSGGSLTGVDESVTDPLAVDENPSLIGAAGRQVVSLTDDSKSAGSDVAPVGLSGSSPADVPEVASPVVSDATGFGGRPVNRVRPSGCTKLSRSYHSKRKRSSEIDYSSGEDFQNSESFSLGTRRSRRLVNPARRAAASMETSSTRRRGGGGRGRQCTNKSKRPISATVTSGALSGIDDPTTIPTAALADNEVEIAGDPVSSQAMRSLITTAPTPAAGGDSEAGSSASGVHVPAVVVKNEVGDSVDGGTHGSDDDVVVIETQPGPSSSVPAEAPQAQMGNTDGSVPRRGGRRPKMRHLGNNHYCLHYKELQSTWTAKAAVVHAPVEVPMPWWRHDRAVGAPDVNSKAFQSYETLKEMTNFVSDVNLSDSKTAYFKTRDRVPVWSMKFTKYLKARSRAQANRRILALRVGIDAGPLFDRKYSQAQANRIMSDVEPVAPACLLTTWPEQLHGSQFDTASFIQFCEEEFGLPPLISGTK